MPSYQLNDRQKALLGSIVPGLKSGEIGLTWTVLFHSDGTSVADLKRDQRFNFAEQGWGEAEKADFTKFTQYGFFNDEGQLGNNRWQRSYTLDDTAIIAAFENDWQMPEIKQAPTVHNDFRNSSFTGITNINSTIQNSTQSIQGSQTLTDDVKGQLITLLNQLNDALQQAPPEHQKDAEKVANHARRVAEDVADPDVDEEQKLITLEGLKKATINLAKVMPLVLPIAMQIVHFVSQLPH